jgi:hypothetical protein
VRLSIDVRVRQVDGDGVKEPLYSPVFFAVDDPALRFLAGDLGSSDWMHAPGVLDKDQVPQWRREVAERGVAGAGYVGFALLYSDGGAGEEGLQAAYEELQATIQTLALEQVARASGLGVMLAAFGGAIVEDKLGDKEPESRLDRLRDGIDPEKLSREIDQGLLSGIGAFREIGSRLLPFVPGLSTAGLVRGGKTLRGIERLTDDAPIVAVTLQAWRVEEIAEKGTLEIRRELPVRGGLKVKLTLEGRVGRDEQR